jgi:hypothetical protein
VIKRALRLYLDRKQRESIDESYARAYAPSDKASKSQRPNEFDEMLAGQAWPDEES